MPDGAHQLLAVGVRTVAGENRDAGGGAHLPESGERRVELQEKGVRERKGCRIGGAQSKRVPGLEHLDLCPAIVGGRPDNEFNTLRTVWELDVSGVLSTLSAEIYKEGEMRNNTCDTVAGSYVA